MRWVKTSGLFLLAAALLAGCKGLNVEREVTVSPNEVKEVIISEAKKEQKVKVDVKAPAPVDVYLVLEKDHKAVSDQLVNHKNPSTGVLAQATGVQDKTLEATIPAGNGFAILLMSRGQSKDVVVKLKVTE